MKIAVDTNVLVYLLDLQSPLHQRAKAALNFAASNGDTVLMLPQVIYELWAVLTRTIAKNGLGWTPARAELSIRQILSRTKLQGDSSDLAMRFLAAVSTAGITGKRSHDWRLAVAAQLAGANAILTFNVADFAGFEGLEVLEPAAGSAG